MPKHEQRAPAHWYFNTFDLSREFSRKETEELRARGRVVHLRSGEVAHFAGDPASCVCLVLSGLLELTRPHEEGREVALLLLRPGEVCEMLSLFGPFTQRDTARARVASEVCLFAPEVFRRLLGARPHLALTMIKALAGKTVTLENRVEALASRSLPARLAHTLLQFARMFGKRGDHGVRFDIPLTQQHLADLVASSRQHVNYILADFRSRRLISGSGRSLTVTNLEELERIAAKGT